MQSVWFLYVILQMERNASSFSPGRMDQYLYPYCAASRAQGMTLGQALEITECLWLKFNQLAYHRNSNSAKTLLASLSASMLLSADSVLTALTQ